jgi:hypothetical protein
VLGLDSVDQGFFEVSDSASSPAAILAHPPPLPRRGAAGQGGFGQKDPAAGLSTGSWGRGVWELDPATEAADGSEARAERANRQRRRNFEASGGETLERLADQISLTEGPSNVPALALLVAAV